MTLFNAVLDNGTMFQIDDTAWLCSTKLIHDELVDQDDNPIPVWMIRFSCIRSVRQFVTGSGEMREPLVIESPVFIFATLN